VDYAKLIAQTCFQSRSPDTYSHTLRVADNFPEGTPERQVAMLHDVLEDAADLVSEEMLRDVFSPGVVDVVVLLTRSDEDTYWEYVHKVAEAPGLTGEVARAVKRADAQDNMNRSIGQPKRQRRYQRVLLILDSTAG
jgi:GTP diphosphokinase / guanosine-3',5'-bis(diphosphate) 3'-diphosphatase